MSASRSLEGLTAYGRILDLHRLAPLHKQSAIRLAPGLVHQMKV